ncbi:MAG: protein kinase [candidate division Zixibacteria bacterium]|nr:protein kinase [candidate division Zixibacteria bacterium]
MVTNDSDDDKTQSHVILTKGTMVSHYRIIEKIGAGGMGEVYLAEDTKLKRKVALKFLPPHLCQDEDCRERFKREAQAAAKLNHPNIVTIHEVAEHSGRPFFAMEHVEGQSLKDVIRDYQPGLDDIINLVLQICEGLAKAHEAGITHRDIKPSNIVIDADGRPKLVDFGLATIQGTDKLTKTGSTLGTVGYMSPEQIKVKEVDHRSDLFSLGVVLYEMIAGRLPFAADNEAATMNAVLNEVPEPLSRYKSGVSGELQRIVSKLLEKDPTLRYQSAVGLISDLKTLTRDEPSVASKPPVDWWNRFVVVGAVIVCLIMAGYWLLPMTEEKATQVQSERIMLAVLPFENLGNPDDENFADGITDAITSRIAKIGGLGVISRTSAMKYKKTDKTLKQIGAELGVSYILEGTILWDKSGDTDRVRIIPQLIRVSDDSHIWTETYERVMTQIFAVQAGIATSIAEKLDITLLEPERDALAEQPTENADAYHAYLAGKRYDADSLAVQMYERAIELDPSFALAYAALSKTHSEMYHYQYDHTEERLQLAKEAVDKALALQPGLPEAHLALGYYYYHGYREYDKALKEFAIAEKRLPNDPRILQAEAFIWRRLGRFEEAQVNLEKAFQLNPRDDDAAIQVAVIHQWLRNYQKAINYIDKAISIRPDISMYHYIKMMTLILMGDLPSAHQTISNAPHQEALALPWVYLLMFERDYDATFKYFDLGTKQYVLAGSSFMSVDLWKGSIYRFMGEDELAYAAFDSSRVFLESHEQEFSGFFGYYMSLGLTYAGLGRKEEAIRFGQLAVEKYPISKDALLGTRQEKELAVVYVMSGEYDLAIDLLEHVMSIPFNLESVATLRLNPIWDPLRDHPRFQALIEKYDTK